MTLAKIRAALAAIDIPAAEIALAAAEAEREALLLTATSDEPVIAAEAAITHRRIARDRAVARKADLERQLVDAEKQDRESAFRARYDQAARLADEAERAIRVEFPSFAVRIADIAEKERKADEALAAINEELIENGVELPALKSPSTRIWGGQFLHPFTFRDVVSLPGTDDNPALGAAARAVTMEAAVALGGIGQAPPVPAFQHY